MVNQLPIVDNTVNHLVELANFFCARSGSTGILIVTQNIELIKKVASKNSGVFVASSAPAAKKDLPPGAEAVDIYKIDGKFLADKVLLCLDFLEEKPPSDQDVVIIKRLQESSVFSILAIKDNKQWGHRAFNKVFSNQNSSLRGRNGEYRIAIGGIAANIYKARFPLVKALAVVPVFNESDIIVRVIKHLLKEGLDVYVMDNWSTDRSYEKLKKLSEKYPKRIILERFPENASGKFELGNMLKEVESVAERYRSKYEWIMLNDADEIRRSPWPDKTLVQSFSFLNSLGYNSADFTLFNLVPTKDGFSHKKRPERFFTFGEFPKQGWAFLQIKAWRNMGKVDLFSSGSHHAKIDNQMIYPLKFLLAHYPLRSEEQARRKIFKERKPRFTAAERKKGWSRHYDDISADTVFIRSSEGLVRYDKTFWSKYLLERISGIGIINN